MVLTTKERVTVTIVFLAFALIGAVLLFSFFPPAAGATRLSYLTIGTSIFWLLIILPVLATYTFVFHFYKKHPAEHYNLSLLVLAAALFGSISVMSELISTSEQAASQPMVLSATSNVALLPSKIPLPTPSPTVSLEPVAFASVNPVPKGMKVPAGQLIYIDMGQVFVADANGLHQTQLTDDDTIKFGLLPAPDGNAVAYRYYPLTSDFESVDVIDEVDSGVAVVTIKTKEIQTIVTADEHRFGSLAFSPDGKYLSMKSFDGDVAKIMEVSSGIELSSVKGKPGTVSAMVWLPNNKISYISDGKLVVADVSGPAYEVVAEGVDVTAPAWSASDRYVAFVKGEKLHLADMQNKTDVVIGSKDVSVIGWNTEETAMYLSDPGRKKPTVVMNLSDGKVTELGALDRALLSPDRTMLAAGSTVIKLVDNTTKSCKDALTSVRWHSGNEYVLGLHNADNGNSVKVVNATTCSSFTLLQGRYLSDAMWQ